MVRLAIALVVFALSGCASIPLSTVARLASFNEQSLSTIDGAGVRVRVAVPDGFEVDPTRTQLTITLGDKKSQEISRSLDLRGLSMSKSQRSLGLFSGNIAVNAYDLALTQQSVERLSELQRFAAQNKLGNFKLNVSTKLKSMPANTRTMHLWADLKLRQTDSYMKLIDGAEIVFE